MTTAKLEYIEGPRVTENLEEGAGGPHFRGFVETTYTEGAPSLRLLQGRVRCCGCYVPSQSAVVVPALREEREGRGTHRIAGRLRDQPPALRLR